MAELGTRRTSQLQTTGVFLEVQQFKVLLDTIKATAKGIKTVEDLTRDQTRIDQQNRAIDNNNRVASIAAEQARSRALSQNVNEVSKKLQLTHKLLEMSVSKICDILSDGFRESIAAYEKSATALRGLNITSSSIINSQKIGSEIASSLRSELGVEIGNQNAQNLVTQLQELGYGINSFSKEQQRILAGYIKSNGSLNTDIVRFTKTFKGTSEDANNLVKEFIRSTSGENQSALTGQGLSSIVGLKEFQQLVAVNRASNITADQTLKAILDQSLRLRSSGFAESDAIKQAIQFSLLKQNMPQNFKDDTLARSLMILGSSIEGIDKKDPFQIITALKQQYNADSSALKKNVFDNLAKVMSFDEQQEAWYNLSTILNTQDTEIATISDALKGAEINQGRIPDMIDSLVRQLPVETVVTTLNEWLGSNSFISNSLSNVASSLPEKAVGIASLHRLSSIEKLLMSKSPTGVLGDMAKGSGGLLKNFGAFAASALPSIALMASISLAVASINNFAEAWDHKQKTEELEEKRKNIVTQKKSTKEELDLLRSSGKGEDDPRVIALQQRLQDLEALDETVLEGLEEQYWSQNDARKEIKSYIESKKPEIEEAQALYAKALEEGDETLADYYYSRIYTFNKAVAQLKTEEENSWLTRYKGFDKNAIARAERYGAESDIARRREQFLKNYDIKTYSMNYGNIGYSYGGKSYYSLEQLARELGFNPSNIARNADGSITKDPTLSTIAEEGPEVIAPIDDPERFSALTASAIDMMPEAQANTVADNMIRFAMSKANTPYGDYVKGGLVCNQLVEAAMKAAGLTDIVHGTVRKHLSSGKYKFTTTPQRGMIGFSGTNKFDPSKPGHMGIVTDPVAHKWWNASSARTKDHPNGGVQETTWKTSGPYAMRFFGFTDEMFENAPVSEFRGVLPSPAGDEVAFSPMPLKSFDKDSLAGDGINQDLFNAMFDYTVAEENKKFPMSDYMNSNNPFGVKNGSDYVSYATVIEGANAYAKQLSTKYASIRNQTSLEQLKYLNQQGEISSRAMISLLEALGVSVDRLTTAVQTSNNYNQRQNMRPVVATQERRFA